MLSLGNPSLHPLSLGIVPKDRGTDRDEALKKRENFSSAGSTGLFRRFFMSAEKLTPHDKPSPLPHSSTMGEQISHFAHN
jgi:hypothetical protein